MDTAFWQKSFASQVSATVPGYDLAATAILAIPWCAGTVIGLGARAIEHTPVWYQYPNTLTLDQVNQGLVFPYVLMSLLGKGATTGLLVLIFMAITSTVSSSMIAVSSIISQDFYRTYVNPQASDRKILRVSHLGVVFHGAFMAGFALMLNYAGATNNWSTYFRPIVSCPGIFPMMLTILWSGQTKLAALLSPILGLICGLATWLSLSWYWGGAINMTTTQLQLPGLYGSIVSFFSPALFSVIISLAKPSKFDWRVFLKIHLIEDTSAAVSTASSQFPSTLTIGARPEKEAGVVDEKQLEQQTANVNAPTPSGMSSPIRQDKEDLDGIEHPFSPETLRDVKRWGVFATVYLIVNILVTIVLWPLSLYRDYVFTKSFFDGWVSMALVWQFLAIGTVVVFPIFDGRKDIIQAVRGITRSGV